MKKIAYLVGSALIVVGVIFALLQGFKSGETEFEKELFSIAEDTYQFFIDYTDPNTGLTLDRVDIDGKVVEYSQTSPTNIAMYLVSTISAAEFDFISKQEAKEKIEVTLDSLQQMEKWNGLYYNWYYTEDASLMTDWGEFISTVDNGWLTAALVVVGQYFPDLASITDPLVDEMDYSHLYDPKIGQMRGGYDVSLGKVTDHHYGMLYSETRLASYVAIGKGDVPAEHWWKLYRTFPKEFDWQNQIPVGETKNYDGIDVFEGHYEYEGIKFVPSWGGSMFEALMPPLFLNERELGKQGLGLNNARHVQGQVAFAKKEGFEVWGFSPAAIVNRYNEFGVSSLGTEGYDDQATVTPHASILGLEYAPEAVEANIAMLKELGTFGEYGFYDTINLNTNEIAKSFLALDQGMIMISISNFLNDGLIRKYFHADPIGKSPEYLLKEEVFSIGE
ncbi:glucoamylase family protein [Bacillus sp. JJ1562]|uniref:glucoamylase family protein n=1 Tax=Bacillus sp. JJ1562 TaxID=3122960 RepID=UPI0030023F1E